MKAKENIYGRMQRFADVTKTLIISGNTMHACKCFSIAEKLSATGNNEVQNAVSTIFLVSVSSFMELHNCRVKDLLPRMPESEYLHQTSTTNP